MTLTLDIPLELQRELADEAEQYGMPLAEYALQLLATRPSTRPPLITGADLVHYWEVEGLIGERTSGLDSAAHARQLRQQAQRRHGE